MKLTTAAVIAFTAASVFGSPIYSKDTAVYARDEGEGFLESFEKRKGGELKPGLIKSIFGAAGAMGGRAASSSAQLSILKWMIPPAPPAPAAPAAIPPPPLHLKRRDLSGHLEFLEKRRGKGGGDRSASLFKSVAGAAGAMGGRAASSVAQLGILKKMIPPAPPPPPPSAQSLPKPASPSPASAAPKPPAPAPLQPPQPPQPPSPFIPPPVPPFPHFPQLLPPAVPHMKRRSLSRRDGHLQTFEKRRRGGTDKSASLFKSVSGAAGAMGGRAASSTAQLALLKTMIPPPPPPAAVHRRDLSRPVARAFAPLLAIKNGFGRFAKTAYGFHKKAAPIVRKKSKVGLIALFDGAREAIKN